MTITSMPLIRESHKFTNFTTNLYEAVAHSLLAGDIALRMVSIENPTQNSVVTLHSDSVFRYYNLSDIRHRGVNIYYRPVTPTRGSFDSFKFSEENSALLFQITTAQKHSINVENMKQFKWTVYTGAKEPSISLCFIVLQE